MVQVKMHVELAILTKYMTLLTKAGTDHSPGLYFFSGVVLDQFLKEEYPELDDNAILEATQTTMVSVEKMFSMKLPQPVMVILMEEAFENNIPLSTLLAAYN